ncbi:hypothetical protein JKF63_03741 [Porcisia hertigi]|uniref:Aquaglyceroporin n=1 Tax=Porcisia hertigi TaxID=2761500 RepID=A0A836IBY4_9TRYP|nr:hypothetical protein JKF63_03741 [Porcisia hertigi]
MALLQVNEPHSSDEIEVHLYAGKEDLNEVDSRQEMDEEGRRQLEGAKRNWTSQEKWPLYQYRWLLREYFAEFFGTFFLISFGDGVCATTKFNAAEMPGYQANASYLAITFGWAFGLCIALFISMGVSGGHLNPAVTLANCLFGTFPWKKAPGFILAQVLGAMAGAANVYGLFKPHFDEGERRLLPGETMTSVFGGIFCTYPGVPNSYAVWSELFNTMALMMGILGLCDDRMTPAINYKPIAVGLLVFTIGITTGVNSGYAINPARDLGPRIFTAMLWGKEPFTLYNYYFWIPTFVPILGAVLGMFLYACFIIPART